MKITVNGKMLDVKATSLAELLIELDYSDMPVATAHNQEFVRRQDRDAAQLQNGDAVEILTPRQGG